MDTEITHQYKDKFHDDIKKGRLTLDKGIFKKYMGRYDNNNKSADKLETRVLNCGLIVRGFHVVGFIYGVTSYLSDSGWKDHPDIQKLIRLHDFLTAQEPIELIFECW